MQMSDVEQRQVRGADEGEVRIRSTLKAGDIGSVLHLHGVCYAQEYDWDHTFEGYIAASLAEFAQSFDPQEDCLWVAEADQRVIGSIGIMGKVHGKAQLRWFLVHPDYRGRGIGRILLSKALQFCCDRQFDSVFLRTAEPLTIAAYLYQSMGFQIINQKTHHVWGKMLTEYRYELNLAAMPQGELKRVGLVDGKEQISVAHRIRPLAPKTMSRVAPTYPAIAS